MCADQSVRHNVLGGFKGLPIGLSAFQELREKDAVYVDKTEYIHTLITSVSKTYFLSRPRRFGKSLLISTLEAIFLGKRDLFHGLFIDQTDYDWTIYPVLRFDFSKWGKQGEDTLVTFIKKSLRIQAELHDITLDTNQSVGGCFDDLIRLIGKTNKVVILIDEYDKAILDVITEPERAHENREILKEFYTIIKAQDENIRFVLLTGVTKFSKVSVFSGLNNLKDLTMTQQAAALCGYTQEELETHFKDWITLLAESQNMTERDTLNKIKTWYNGYRFSEENVRVYNPFSTLLLFDEKSFKAHWFETGTPRFLVDLLRKSEDAVPQDLDGRVLPESAFSTFEIGRLNVLALLFQTGYITIRDYDPKTRRYTLGYPNFEVREAFSEALLTGFSELKTTANAYIFELQDALEQHDLESVFDVLAVFFATIPYDIQIKREKYYQSIFYLIFSLLGLIIHAEVRTNKGRIDAVVETDTHVYIFEFKIDDTAQAALEQIRTQEYYQRYQVSSKTVTLLGVAFDTEKREISQWVQG